MLRFNLTNRVINAVSYKRLSTKPNDLRTIVYDKINTSDKLTLKKVAEALDADDYIEDRIKKLELRIMYCDTNNLIKINKYLDDFSNGAKRDAENNTSVLITEICTLVPLVIGGAAVVYLVF